MLADLGAQMFRLADLLRGLALQRRGRGEGRVGLNLPQLLAQQRVLLPQVRLQRADVGEVVGEGLRGQRVRGQGVREGFGVGGGAVEDDSCGGEGVEGLGARGGEVVFYRGEEGFVFGIEGFGLIIFRN